MKDRCTRFRAMICDYAEGSLDKNSAARLDKHIKTCPNCAALLGAQFDSYEGSGKLYILDSLEAKGKTATRRILRTIAVVFSCMVLITLAAMLIMRISGYVRMADVYVDSMTIDEVQGEKPELLITFLDLTRADSSFKAGSSSVSYTSGFYNYTLTWPADEAPTEVNINKYISARYKISDIIRETKYSNKGNTEFEKYTAVLDLWGTLTQ